MDGLDKKVIAGVMTAAVITSTLYALLSISQGGNPESLDREIVRECRDLTRESADILVQVARDDLDPENPNDSQRLAEFETRIADIEGGMSELGCYETREQWMYGSFKQEMFEYEAYIADLVKQNAGQ